MNVLDWLWSIIWAAAGVGACCFILGAILIAAAITSVFVKEIKEWKHDKW